MKLVLATGNQGKVRELEPALKKLGIELLSLRDFDLPPVDESGSTFLENALLKAEAVSTATGLWALAEDSGLEVDALGGAPGVYSARYAGENATDEENNRKLLREIAGVEPARRRARFRTVMVLLAPNGSRWTTEGTCEGCIAEAPRGEGGFGYDPLFVPDGRDRTFAQMSLEEKEALSHRGKALRRMLQVLEGLKTDEADA